MRTCSNTLQSWDAALGLATFQELVMGDAALPIGVEDGAQMMLMSLAEAGVLLFATGLR